MCASPWMLPRKPLGLFGQIVIGPPGSGKSTYCTAMQEMLAQLGRKVAVVNLDPANDILPYDCAVDLRDLIQLDEVMQALELGPNGGLIYCMEYLYTNRAWLADAIQKLYSHSPKTYVIFDCPGQVELYCNSGAFRKILAFLIGLPPALTANSVLTTPQLPEPSASSEVRSDLLPLGLRLTCVHLVDSHYCTCPGKFISVLLTSLVAMLQLGLPHVNVLSKVDLIEQYAPLKFNLDFFTDVLNLSYLVDQLDDDPFYSRYKKLNSALAGIIQDNALISFMILDVQDRHHLERIMRSVDKGNGYVFGVDEQRTLQSMMACASGAEFTNDWICLAQEKYSRDHHTA